MNDKTYEMILETFQHELKRTYQEMSARIMALETQLDEMRTELRYERSLRATDEMPIVEWSEND